MDDEFLNMLFKSPGGDEMSSATLLSSLRIDELEVISDNVMKQYVEMQNPSLEDFVKLILECDYQCETLEKIKKYIAS